MGVPLSRPLPRRIRAALHHLRRRRLVGAALAGALPRAAAGQSPAARRPLRVLVGFPAGSTPDVFLRMLSEPLAQRLGQAVVVENRPGATGAIAAEAAARAAPDGETLLLMPHSTLLLPAMRRDLPFDPVGDFAPVAGVASAPLLLVVPPGGPHDLAGFVAAARAAGDRLAYGMSGVGASPHLAMALLARAAGFAPTEVVFRGDPEIFTGLLSGQVGAAFALAPTALALVREGSLRALGATSRARLPALPEVPTMAEAGWPDVTLASWWGLVAPRGTPPGAVERIAAALRPALAAPGFGGRLAAAGAEVLDLGPAPFAAFIAEERRRLLAIYAGLGIGAG